MSKPVKLIEIIAAIVKDLRQEFGCEVYSDEVLEQFTKPCFFIAVTAISTPQTVNFIDKDVMVVLTYFPKAADKNEVHYMDVFDRVQLLFSLGIQTGERFIHVDSVTEDRAGEEQDILQVNIHFSYLEQQVKAVDPNADTIGELHTRVVVNEGKQEEEKWQN